MASCPRGALFDGTNDYLTRGADLNGLVDGPQGTLHLWIQFASAADGVRLRLLQNSFVVIDRNTGNQFSVSLGDTTGTLVYQYLSSGVTINGSLGWCHIVTSWDTNFSAGNKLGRLYVNNMNRFNLFSDASAAFNVDYTAGNWGIGARFSDGANKFNGDLAEIWFHPTYIDLSIEANLRKFISAAGGAVDLGSDGSLPIGTPPAIYLRGPAASLPTNLGTGGNFTVTGALTDSATDPPCSIVADVLFAQAIM